MIPTNYLRWHRSKTVAFEGGAATLQQWWYDASADAKAHGTTRVTNKRNDVEPEHGYGEWRDVPIAEE